MICVNNNNNSIENFNTNFFFCCAKLKFLSCLKRAMWGVLGVDLERTKGETVWWWQGYTETEPLTSFAEQSLILTCIA